MNIKTAALLSAAAALTLSTGCTVMGGALLGADLFGNLSGPGLVSGFTGSGVVCLGTTADDVELSGEYRIQGRIVDSTWGDVAPGFDNVVPCWTDVESTLRVEDEDGEIWTVGYAWLDAYGYDMTPSVWDDGAVDVLVRHELGTQASGVVITKPSGSLVYAMEAGRDTNALQDGDLPGVRVQTADRVGSLRSDCGQRDVLSVRFESSSDELVLDPGDDAGMEVDGDYFTTCSIESFEFQEDDGCDDDISSEVSWVMFQ